jgi:predicted acetyltransferase
VDIEIRTIRPEELEAWMTGMSRAFNEFLRPEWVELERKVVEPERTFGALDDGEFVGGASTSTMRLRVPGGDAPMAGVTGVGVAPTHRRRGVASALMRHQLDHIRGREPLAGLYASEGGIYGRYGFGIASFGCRMEIERDRTAFVWLPHERGRVRLLDRERAFTAMEPVYDRARATQPGMLERRGAWWDARFEDFEQDRDGASAFFFALHEGGDGADAYAVYRFKHEWADGVPQGVVEVEELIATSPESFANMWRFVFDLDLAGRIKAGLRPIDDPLLSLLADARRLRLTIADALWLRLIDVPAALAARRYASAGSMVFELSDGFCPWNEGRYVLEAGPDGAECRATDADPDLALTSAELGAAFLGGTRFGHLARAGRVHERSPGALGRADLMFGWDPAPWCPQEF